MRGRRIAFHHAEKASIVHQLSIGDFRSILIETPMKDRRFLLGARLVHWHGNDDCPDSIWVLVSNLELYLIVTEWK